MSKIRTLLKGLLKRPGLNRSLFAQILFTVLAFAALTVLSYTFMTNIVHDHLLNNTESVIAFAQAKIESDLLEPKTTLGNYAQTIRAMLMRGEGADVIERYTLDLSGYMYSNWRNLPTFNGLYGYFKTIPDGPVFVNSINWLPPDDYKPSDSIWYQAAVSAGGEIAETRPFVNMATGEIVFSYSRIILDFDGHPLGVTSLDVQVNTIGEYVVETALAQGGYGMVLSEDLLILAHPNKEYVGRYLWTLDVPISGLDEDLLNGRVINEHSTRSYRDEPAVVFFRQLPNGWYLGLVTPKGPYYKSVTSMSFFIGVLAMLFTITVVVMLIRVDNARHKADMESKHKSVFLANMSHEIRTPMNAIIGMTTIGKSASENERKDYCFLKIQDASNHLLGVINDILDMSKIEANKFELSPSEFNFEKMLQRVVNVVNFRVDEKKQKLTVHIDSAIPRTLIGDDQRLAQVITNLLGNAVKFTPEYGTITVSARFIGVDNGFNAIEVMVSDTGIGISPAQQAKLFQSFQQAESSTTRKFGGTGLGLSISKNIVEMMGGKIWLESKPGEGSQFFFNVSMKRGSEDKKRELLPAGMEMSGIRILAVDDDKDVLDFFTEIAGSFDITCHTAASGEDALRMIERNGGYHIYFIDWKMPSMNGIQLTDKLKTYTSANSVVIMISAGEWTAISGEAKKAGVDKFLSKPLFPSSIADLINECLGVDHGKIQETRSDITGIFSGKHILLAEDVEINREIVLALLEPTGLKIDCAWNGAEAVRMFRENPESYDMIFMDVQMPEMDGYEATRNIRALDIQKANTIPIVAMTANVFREDIEKSRNAGMNSHVGKPLDLNEVLNKLRAYLL